MMLAILDLLQEPGGAGVTSHDVARLIIYPRLSVGRGAEWKSSSERRRTQRLIEEARGLMQGGYRALLAGPAGRQKLPRILAAPALAHLRATTLHDPPHRLFSARRLEGA